MSIWFILVVTILTDGKVTADVRYPNTPEYNNEQACDEVGKLIVEKEQAEIGTKTGIVYYVCKEITSEEQKKATSKGNAT